MSRRFASPHGLVRSVLCVSLIATFVAPAAAAKSPIKRMPTYRGEAGELLDDPAKMSQETRAFESAYKAFKLAAREYRGEVRELITGEIDRRKQRVSDTYQTQIDKIMGQQDKLRKEAIARLESFIFRHRGHPRYTPDAVFRLAELYYEDSKATAAYSQDHFEELECMYKRGKLLDPPVEEDANYSRSIALYKYLHWVPPGTRMPALAGKLKGVVLPKRWPNYRHADAALYLQGFCEQEMGDTDRAIATYSSVAKHYPKSRYIAEAWLRVGEIYFDESEFEQAADAYRRAAEHAKKTKDAKFYELALYKLGWAYFQMYRYPEAVGWFQKLIEFSDAKSEQKKKGMDLRREAIEYLAKSLAEPSWDDDGCEDFGGPDAKGECPQLDPRLRPLLYVSGVIKPDTAQFGQWKSVFEGEVLSNLQKNLQARAKVREQLMVGKPYVREVLTVYAKTLVDFTETEQYRQALLVLRYIVDTWPLDRDAQKLQRLIIDLVSVLTQGMGALEEEVAANPNKQEALLELSLARKAQIAAINERKKYLRMFSPGSPWHEKWGADKDLARQVEDYSAKLRLEFARLTLQTAQTLKAAGKTEEALAKYREAAVEYEKLLAADPNGDGAYDHLWQLAEIYFYAGEKCSALKNANGDLLVIPKGPMKGELVPWADDKIDEIKKACGVMAKSLPLYERLRSWKGAKPKDSEGKVVDRTVDAAQSSIMVQERLIQARAAYPAADPERLESRLLPSIRPDSERDLETVEKNNKELQESKGQKTNFAIPRQDVPEVVVRWIQAVDRYLAGKFKVAEDPNRDEKYALQAAELLYKNRNFDPWKEQPYKDLKPEFFSARLRFRAIIQNFPKTDASVEAAKNLLTSYQMEVDVDNMKKVAKWLDEKGLAPKDTLKEIKQTLRTIFLGSIAVKAEALHNKAKLLDKEAVAATDRDEAFSLHKKARAGFKAAAREYRRLQHETDKTKVKLQSLLNAVALYYRAQEWDESFATLDEAEQMLRGINEKSSTSKSERKTNIKRLIDVIQRRANLQFRFFRLPEAIANFREVYKLDSNGSKGKNALQNAALLAYRNANWDLAIELNEEVVRRLKGDFKKKIEWDNANQRIVDAYKAKGNIDDYISALKTQISRYQRDKSASDKVYAAWGEIARLYRGRGKKRDEVRIWKMLIKDFDKRALPKNGGVEAKVVAEAQFRLMEPRYKSYMKRKLKENKRLRPAKRMKDLQAQLKAMMDVVLGAESKQKNKDTGEEYYQRSGGMYDLYRDNVAIYGARDWSYAAFLYRAKMLIHLARTIYDAPRPENMDEDSEEAYEEFLEKFGGQIENKAIKSLELALKDAEAKGIVNDWVNQLRMAINRYKPAEYPLLKEAKRLTKFPNGTDPGVEKELR